MVRARTDKVLYREAIGCGNELNFKAVEILSFRCISSSIRFMVKEFTLSNTNIVTHLDRKRIY